MCCAPQVRGDKEIRVIRGDSSAMKVLATSLAVPAVKAAAYK